MPPELAHALLLIIVAASIVLMLVRPRGIAEVYWVGGGAVLLLMLRLVPLRLAGRAVAQGTDVYLFLAGMMLLSELAREQGVFDWVSSLALLRSRGSCKRLFSLVYAAGTVITICMSNDATAVVLTPAILSMMRKARVQPLPYLFVCAMIANAASFVLPISNPANLVVFRRQMPPLGHWMAAFGVPSLCSIAVTYLVLRWYFRRDLCERIECEVEQVALSVNGKLVLAGLALVIAVLLTASALDLELGLPTCLAAIVITAVVCVKARTNPLRMVRAISWATLALVAGLFLLVNAVESIGALHDAEATLHWARSLPLGASALVTGFAVGVANNLVNNLPLGLVAGAAIQATHLKGVLANAVLIGVDLGPNLSVTGSLATILWLLALRREDLDVSFRDFMKAGALAMPAALLAAIGGLLLMNALL